MTPLRRYLRPPGHCTKLSRESLDASDWRHGAARISVCRCGGTLVGTNRGEFGGGLYWVREDGNELRQTLEGTPVIAFLADDEHVLVFLGISHGGRSEGSVLLLEPDTAAERPRLRHWYPLPSEPIQLQLDGTRLRMAFLQSRTSWAHDMYAWNDTTPRDSGPPLLDGWDEILDAVLEDGTFRFPAAPR